MAPTITTRINVTMGKTISLCRTSPSQLQGVPWRRTPRTKCRWWNQRGNPNPRERSPPNWKTGPRARPNSWRTICMQIETFRLLIHRLFFVQNWSHRKRKHFMQLPVAWIKFEILWGSPAKLRGQSSKLMKQGCRRGTLLWHLSILPSSYLLAQTSI